VLAVALPLLALAGPAEAAVPGPVPALEPGAERAAAPASAEPATAAPRAATGGRHCALGAGAGQRLHCFDTFPAAVAFATGGRVTTAPASPAQAALDPGFTVAVEAAAAPQSTTASVLVGIEYADANYGGSSLAMYAPGGCDNSLDVDYRFPTLPSGWNDRISSFRSYSNCAQQLFAATYFGGGSLTGVISSLSYVGPAANDRASSITFN